MSIQKAPRAHFHQMPFCCSTRGSKTRRSDPEGGRALLEMTVSNGRKAEVVVSLRQHPVLVDPFSFVNELIDFVFAKIMSFTKCRDCLPQDRCFAGLCIHECCEEALTCRSRFSMSAAPILVSGDISTTEILQFPGLQTIRQSQFRNVVRGDNFSGRAEKSILTFAGHDFSGQ